MNRREQYRKVAINILISIVISMVLNFAYFVFLMVGPNREPAPKEPPQVEVENKAEAKKVVEKLTEVEVDSLKSRLIIREENLVKQSAQRNQPNPLASSTGTLFIIIDLFFYAAVSMAFLSIMTSPRHWKRRNRYGRRVAACIILLLPIYFLAPQLTWKGEIVTTAHVLFRLNALTILKLATTFIIAILYGKIYELLYTKQSIEMENEMLKNENLTWQYNTLVNQVNPHFLFNSLNSLSMLVREEKSEDALTYISRMSDTYRYIIEEGKVERTTVADELRFLEAYRYLLEVRYAGKLHINVEVDHAYDDYELPPLSIQPLIENAVKHNAITSSKPLNIDIRTENDYIVVSNPIHPKLQKEESTGIGLGNLSSRYELVIGRKVEVECDNNIFRVRLPLNRPTR